MPTRPDIRPLLNALNIGGDATVEEIGGEHYNDAHLITIGPRRLVLKTYKNPKLPRELKARREYRALDMLQRSAVPTPKPLYVDPTGDLLGDPILVTEFVAGAEPQATDDAEAYTRAAASMLARIHQTPVDPADVPLLMYGNAEVVWFLKDGVPDYMAAHPDGEFVWNAVAELLERAQPTPKTLVHTDYWTGNILWNGREVVAALDWEEAAHGEPGIDVAYCRMDMCLNGMGREAADRFLREYEGETGRAVENLALWELAASARPMYHGDWEREVRDELRRFIADARERVGM